MIVFLLAALLLSAAPGRAGVAQLAVQIRASSVVSLIHTAFAGTQVRLHSLGRERAEGPYLTWHEPNASFVRLGPMVGGAEVRFTIPELVINTGPHGFLKYYVNEITVRSISAGWDTSGFRLVLRLESAGTELKGYHTALSKSARDNGAPDVALKDMRITVSLAPAARAKSISYDRTTVDFAGAVTAAGNCRYKGMDLCGELGRFRTRLRERVEGELGAALNREETRDRVADLVRAHLPDLLRAAGARNVGAVTEVTVSGDALTVAYEPR